MTWFADAHDVRRARDAPEPLRAFNDAGVLRAGDVHVARRLLAIGSETDGTVALAAALAVRGPRRGHVYVDLGSVAAEATADDAEDRGDREDDGDGDAVTLPDLPWPDPASWVAALARSPLVAVGEDDGAPDRPLRLVGSRLYLDRYWREERQIAFDLRTLGEGPGPAVDMDVLAAGLERLFAGDDDERQRLAAATATLRRFAVVAGGPGTGKTTTVARIVALLVEQAAARGEPAPLVALAAPTGKAAVRLEEAVHAEAKRLDLEDGVRRQLLAVSASTLHRLLGWRPDSHSRFRHGRSDRLAHDAVIVDETSMVSLTQMARLVEAVRPDAQLVLVGDPGQLRSIDAGAVLGDIVGPAASGLHMRSPARRALARATGCDVVARESPADVGIGDGIVVLDRSHRYGEAIAALADGVRRGDGDATIEVLRSGAPDIVWIPDVDAPADGDAMVKLRDGAVAAARAVIAAAAAGDAAGALEAIGSFRLLCAHRRGPHGASTWRARIESWLAAEIDGFAAQGAWYVGRPLLVTENDYGLRLYNGDTGVVVAGAQDGRVVAAFERRGEVVRVSPARLGAVDTVYAMTIHKAQGSQFATAAVVLPPARSPIMTRELLYTAVTRARSRLVVAATEDAVRAAVARPVARASGLRSRLWGDEAGA